MSHENIPDLEITSRQEWRRWLQQNHHSSTGIWLVTWKKHHPDKYVAYDDIVEEALCFGWIDSLPRKLDESRTKLYICPRKKGSPWSALNKSRLEKLRAAGLMTTAGDRAVAAARDDGSFYIYDDIEAMIIPEDLKSAFRGQNHAYQNFQAFAPSAVKGLLWWIKSAKSPATRRDRITKTVSEAAGGQVANAYRKPGKRGDQK